MTPTEARRIFRERRYTGPTSGIAIGHAQANLVVVPEDLADSFEEYCRMNPKPCPLIERLPAGSAVSELLAPRADVRTDLPLYRVYAPDCSYEEMPDIHDVFERVDVAFLLGCSFGFEQALIVAGLVPRHIDEGVNVPMFRTNRETTAVGPFGGSLVVSMRPVLRDRVQEACEITAPFERAHGAPVYHGDPAGLGIRDIGNPEWGDAVTIREGEVPVFWACGVTSQVAVENALRQGALSQAITHSPGSMFICDI
ncbi:D-glutamate cyclase family protein [Planctomycetota bacterium]